MSRSSPRGVSSLAARRAMIPPPLIPLQQPPRSSLPLNKVLRREALAPPLIPIQVSPPTIPHNQPARPLIPLQQSAPHARLQHELSVDIVDEPDVTPTVPAAASITVVPSIRLRRRQNVITTVTDADVIIVDQNGSTVARTTLTAVPSGSLTVTYPFTTVTISPVASISEVYSLSPDPTTQAVPVPTQVVSSIPPAAAQPAATTATSDLLTSNVAPISIPSSVAFVQDPNNTSQQILSSPLPTPGLPPAAISVTQNDQLGLPGAPAATTAPLSTGSSSLSDSPNSISSTPTSLSSAISPTTLATLLSSTSLSASLTTDISGVPLASPSATLPSSFSSTTIKPSSTDFFAGGNGSGSATPTATNEAPASSTTAAVGAAGADSGASPVNVPVVGGVVGGLAGLAVLLVLVLLLLRWWKRRSGATELRSVDNESIPPGTSHSNAPMTENPFADPPGARPEPGTVAGFGAGAGAGVVGAAGLGAMLKRWTGGSTATTDTTPSERGFQNLGGRKLESVLISGGDGYGDPSRSGNGTPTSFYRNWNEKFPYETPSNSSSMVVGPATPYRQASSHMAELAASPIGRPNDDTVRMMPGPARSAQESPGWTFPGPAFQQYPASAHASLQTPLARPRPIDPLGRSRHSQDGSRTSKFAEDL